MSNILTFLHAYGILILSCALIIYGAAALSMCATRTKRMEERMDKIQQAISGTVDALRTEAQENDEKQRRVLSKNMENFSESVTRAILNGAEEEKKE